MSRVDRWQKRLIVVACLLAACGAGCEQDMADEPRYDPLEASEFFADGMGSRPLVEGTVARGQLRVDTAFYEGMQNGQLVEAFPLPQVAEQLGYEGDDRQVTLRILEHGQERFQIFCAPCHDRTGHGRGMVVLRGFPAPPSYHSDRLREAPVGHFFDVATKGFGRMPSYSHQIPPADRWAIAAYIQALQLSQQVDADRLSDTDRAALSPRSP